MSSKSALDCQHVLSIPLTENVNIIFAIALSMATTTKTEGEGQNLLVTNDP
jgi:hypothetical protein